MVTNHRTKSAYRPQPVPTPRPVRRRAAARRGLSSAAAKQPDVNLYKQCQPNPVHFHSANLNHMINNEL